MEKHELKKCPFCGGDAVLDNDDIKDGHGVFIRCWYVECERCAARGTEFAEFYYPKEDCIDRAVRSWNRRVEVE